MCHSSGNGLLFAILAVLSILNTPHAIAQTSGGIEQNSAASLIAIPAEALTVTGASHVPVTVSVHNASEARPLVLTPFSTIEIFVATTDMPGGTGANFVVDWAAAGEIAEPAVEARWSATSEPVMMPSSARVARSGWSAGTE